MASARFFVEISTGRGPTMLPFAEETLPRHLHNYNFCHPHRNICSNIKLFLGTRLFATPRNIFVLFNNKVNQFYV